MPRLYIATNGLSVWTSDDLGENLIRTQTDAGMYSGRQIWGLAAHPTGSGEVLVGTDDGIYGYDPQSQKWRHRAGPLDAAQMVTAIAYSPHDPSIVLAGVQPAALWRSEDGGWTWHDLRMPMRESVALRFHGTDANNNARVTMEPTGADDPTKHWTRVCHIVWDRDNPMKACACVEIDDAWLSEDGGRSFARTNQGLTIGDVHGMAIVREGGQRKLFAATALGLHVSRDDGASWQMTPIDSPWQYTRSIVERPDRTGVMYLTNGSGSPGWQGRLYRSQDYGETWVDVRLPGSVQSSMYFLAVHPSDPAIAFAAAALGQLYRTTDGGQSWHELPHRLGEIRSLCVVP